MYQTRVPDFTFSVSSSSCKFYLFWVSFPPISFCIYFLAFHPVPWPVGISIKRKRKQGSENEAEKLQLHELPYTEIVNNPGGTIRLGAVNWYLGTHDLVKGRSLPPSWHHITFPRSQKMFFLTLSEILGLLTAIAVF